MIALSILVITATAGRWKAQIGMARGAIYSKRASAIKISQNIRQQAKQTLLLKRAIKRGNELIEAKGNETEKLIGELAVVEKIDDRILIVDDKRGRKEMQWAVRVVHNNYHGLINPLSPIEHHNGWKNGKQCVVWATDETAAFLKGRKIFSEDEGYVISGISLVVSSTSYAEVGDD